MCLVQIAVIQAIRSWGRWPSQNGTNKSADVGSLVGVILRRLQCEFGAVEIEKHFADSSFNVHQLSRVPTTKGDWVNIVKLENPMADLPVGDIFLFL